MCIWVGRFCTSFSFLCLFSTYAFLIRDAFTWGDRQFGLILAGSGIGGAIQTTLYPRASAAIGKHAVVSAGCISVAFYFSSLALTTVPYLCVTSHLLTMSLFIMGSAVIDPGLPDLVGFYASDDQMGFAQGVSNAFRSLAAVLAPIFAGHAYDVSPRHVYAVAAAAAAFAALAVASAPQFAAYDARGAELLRAKACPANFGALAERKPLRMLGGVLQSRSNLHSGEKISSP
jgi:hypothetical protein